VSAPRADIAAALRGAERALGASSDSPRLDAEVLLAHALGKPRSHLLAWPAKHLDAAAARYYTELVAARQAGQPVAYLTGEREFWSLRLEVNPATLIPRPATELLVERAGMLIERAAVDEVLELGTGCGAIALALAHRHPRLQITATDICREALGTAQRNARRLGLGSVRLVASDWFAAIAGRFPLIVTNPPYVRSGDPHLRSGDARREPRRALDGGSDGLDALRRIVSGAGASLRPGGWLLLEHGYDQGAAVRALLQAAAFTEIATVPDLAGQPRMSQGRRPAQHEAG